MFTRTPKPGSSLLWTVKPGLCVAVIATSVKVVNKMGDHMSEFPTNRGTNIDLK